MIQRFIRKLSPTESIKDNRLKAVIYLENGFAEEFGNKTKQRDCPV